MSGATCLYPAAWEEEEEEEEGHWLAHSSICPFALNAVSIIIIIIIIVVVCWGPPYSTYVRTVHIIVVVAEVAEVAAVLSLSLLGARARALYDDSSAPKSYSISQL